MLMRQDVYQRTFSTHIFNGSSIVDMRTDYAY